MKNRMARIVKLVSIVLIFVMIFSLSGCREAPILQQIIYTQNAEIDEDQQKTNNDEDNLIIDYKIASHDENEDSDVQRDFNYNVPVKGEDDNEMEADDEVYAKTREERSPAPVKKTTSQNEVSDTDEVGSVEEDEILSDLDKNLREIVDATEKPVDIPKDVDTVAAVGDVAVYVEMLGGTGRLVATSESFSDNELAATVFGSTEVENVASLWSKTGSTPISDESFRQLVDVVRPEVCFVVSEQESFTDEQLGELSEKNIYVITLPKLNTISNIQRAVELIGEVLGDKSDEEGKKNAPAVAKEYISWMNNIIAGQVANERTFSGPGKVDFNNDCYATYTTITNEDAQDIGQYTLYISDWDEGASYTIATGATDIASGVGLAIAPSGYSTTPTAYFMSLAGVCNTAALSADLFIQQNWYVSPLTPTTFSVSKNAGVWDKDINKTLTEIDSKTRLGSENFKKVIVASKRIKDAIEADKKSEYGLWKNYGFKIVNQVTGYGFVHDSTFIFSNVIDEYDVIVNPCGAGSWASGSPEAPLESIWTNAVFTGDYTIEDVKSEITQFYTHFYGYTPNDTVIEKILGGQAE